MTEITKTIDINLLILFKNHLSKERNGTVQKIS